ncbi:prolyl oligopeptidase family serine peptidase [Bifidobacterium sp. MA2]|uniref:Prolyl oligopeptidase family serine peptidase n=1 Tax=Bifidobacterium santillanense TaxID=2809028 RepID=A0ABS5UP30_9BIFI|nr:prolyl oligopeptidase family serine peptidase [Bifidobacterium santillanense]MBT1172672.1 prolyl oligopeptidase family serine peptidase [Bifidobacterium santillanense]
MNDEVTDAPSDDTADAIAKFPRAKARTLRFTSGAPRSAKVIGDGSKALFLRSDGPEDLATSLWLSWFDADGDHYETKLADPRELLGDKADSEDVPAEEKARRERAREGGTGIVGYSVAADGDRVVFTINGRLFLTEIGDPEDADHDGDLDVRTRELAGAWLDEDPDLYTPVLNPRISPDGWHVLYTTGEHLMLVDIGDWPSDGIDREDPAGELDDGVSVVADAQDEALTEGLYEADADADDDDDDEFFDDRITAIYGVSVEDEDGETAENTWRIGLAEFVAGEEMDRYDGFWWAPDSRHVLFESFDTADEPVWHLSDPADPERPAAARRYPRALTRNADVYLTVISLAFNVDQRYRGITANADVEWDRDAYEYVAAVSWTKGHDPLVLVQNRRQTRDQVLEVAVDGASDADDDVRTLGSTRVLEEHANDQWLDLISGTPARTPDGRLVTALNDMQTDTNRLMVDGRPFTPAGWQVRHVLDVTDDDVLAVVQRTPELAPDEPIEWRLADAGVSPDDASRIGAHDARSFDVVSFGYDGSITPLTVTPGSWTASRAGDGCVITGRDMTSPDVRMSHSLTAALPAEPDEGEERDPALTILTAPVASHAARPGFTPNVTFTRLGEHRLYTAIIAPSASSPYAGADKLPVLMKPYGGPGFQQVVASQSFYWEAQWWADQGFLVVTADGRGTTGRGPKWDREIFEDMKAVTLADQVEAVRALPEALAALPGMPAPDLDRVCMIGWSYGGFLSALAVLDAPDVFRAACAGAPPTDWTLYDTHYTERYLGLDPAVYERNSIVADAPGLRRPLMLIHGFADDNVTIAHSLRLSQALMAAGRPHTFLPLTGITHMTNDETVAENLLILQRDFLRNAFESPLA